MRKLLQTTLAIFALATMANSAFAVATDIYISGSTAFRASAVKAIYDVFKQPGNSLVDYVYDNSSAANPYKASFMGWHGFVGGGANEVYVHYTATGSAAGVIDLVNCPTCGTGTTNQVKFIADSAITGQGLGPAEPFGGVGTAGYNNGVQINGTGYATVIGVANSAAFTDASFTADANALATAPGNGASIKAHILAAGLVDAGVTAGPKHTVGVVDFVWTAGKQTASTGLRAGGVVVERHRSSLLFPDDRARHVALSALRRRPALSAVRWPVVDSPAAHPASPAGSHR